MRIIGNLVKWKASIPASVATIGVFDALHLGHQHLIRSLKESGSSLKIPSVLITFDPSPKEVLNRLTLRERLLTKSEKIALMERFNLDFVAFIKFSRAFARIEAEGFVKKILVGKLNVRHLVVGEDFSLGKNRKGNTEYLREIGSRLGFDVTVVKTFLKDSIEVKSRAIREYIRAGKIEVANEFLGRSYSVTGIVGRGRGAGTQIGFPTANIEIPEKMIPKEGIYATYACLNGKKLPSVTYVGKRPTFPGLNLAIETHILNFHKNIYKREIKVEFLKRIRWDQKFKNADDLAMQISKDIANAKDLL